MRKVKKLASGRKRAFLILKKLGRKFHKNIAVRALADNGITNPYNKFRFLVLNGNIKLLKKNIYIIVEVE